MNIGRLQIEASRWPWMALESHWSHGDNPPKKYGWGKVPGMGRFGAGWNWKLGFAISERQVTFDLLFGMVSFYVPRRKD